MNTARYARLVEIEGRAHERFIRRSDHSLAVFPQDRFELSRRARQAARLADRLRAALVTEQAVLLQLNRRNPG